eukprot:Gb_22864 [translate_table: standard]
MAMTITTSCLSLNARAICWSNSKSTSICASISTTKVAALNCCGFCTCRLQNSIMWTMRGNTTQAKDFIQRRRIRAVAEDTQLISEEAQEQQPATAVVSQSDKLTMFFKVIKMTPSMVTPLLGQPSIVTGCQKLGTMVRMKSQGVSKGWNLVSEIMEQAVTWGGPPPLAKVIGSQRVVTSAWGSDSNQWLENNGKAQAVGRTCNRYVELRWLFDRFGCQLVLQSPTPNV